MPAVDDIRRRELHRLQREQVLRGVAAAIAEKGYSAVTISDIAAAARASRTTVYAHFPDKDSALLALHEETTERVSAALEEARLRLAADADWSVRLRALVAAFLDPVSEMSAGERASLLEVASAGPLGRRARRRRLEELAGLVRELSADLAEGTDEIQPLSAPLALAFVAAAYELVERAAEDGPDAIRALAPTIVELVARLTRAA